MSVLIFIIILAVLIIVHEYGHFIVAKKGGIRVDEFGLGYPPRAKTLFKRKGTLFTLNWLPFGGFVKIFGENPDDESLNGEFKASAFVNKPKWLQALVLFAGPFMNFLFAWLIIFLSLLIGLPTGIDEKMNPEFITDKAVMVTEIYPNSPAEMSGIKPGDVIDSVKIKNEEYFLNGSDELKELVGLNNKEVFEIKYKRGETLESVNITPKEINGGYMLGLSLNSFGVYKPSFFIAFIDSFKFTWSLISSITEALFNLIIGAFSGGADISNLTGPVGIVSLVGDATKLGLVYILSFAAVISVNLGVVNLIPFPALDGGRLLFILIEKIKGSRVNHNVLNWLNFVGFSLLIVLMIFITYHDIVKIFR